MDDQEWRDRQARQRGTDLEALRWHWDTAYRITWMAGWFTAVRKDDGTIMHRQTADLLDEAIRADYNARPIPRS